MRVKPIPTDLIKRYGEKDGPLPAYPPGNIISDRFWRGYIVPTTPKNLLGVRGSVANAAAKAGIARQKVEPDIDPKTDPRAKRSGSNT